MDDDLSDWVKALAREQAKTIAELHEVRDGRGRLKYGAIEDLPFERQSVLITCAHGRYQLIGFHRDPAWFKEEGMIGIYDAHERQLGDITLYQGRPFRTLEKSGFFRRR